MSDLGEARLARWRLTFLTAFTLVEVLVVIAIVTALLALLIPSLGSARRQARGTTCLSQLRMLTVAIASYSNEDRGNHAVPVHPIADRNALHDEGYFDFGGATGAENVWNGVRFGVASERTAPTRPLNKLLFPNVNPADADLLVFRCPGDVGLTGMNGGNRRFWDDAMRSQPMFDSVGTSYVANAYRARANLHTDGFEGMRSVGPFLRSVSAVPASGETILLVDAPMWYSASSRGPETKAGWIARNSWHGKAGEYSAAFVDGHAAKTKATQLESNPRTNERWGTIYLRGVGFRFDCLPSPPIIDAPTEIVDP